MGRGLTDKERTKKARQVLLKQQALERLERKALLAEMREMRKVQEATEKEDRRIVAIRNKPSAEEENRMISSMAYARKFLGVDNSRRLEFEPIVA